MRTADLEEKRLNDRLKRVLSASRERPVASTPAACGGHAEMAAAYRFFDNEKVTAERILEPHIARTWERIIMLIVVQLGGDVPTPQRRDPPGPQTLWRGLQRMSDQALAWNTFGPGAQTTEQTYL